MLLITFFYFFILNVCVLVKFVCLFCFSFMCCLSWLLISFKCVMKQSFEQQRGLCLRPSPRSETRLRTLTKRKDTKLFNSLSRILAARSVCTVFFVLQRFMYRVSKIGGAEKVCYFGVDYLMSP